MDQLYPISHLKERYNIGKQAEINRRKFLKISPTKINGQNYITEQELKRLDELDAHLKAGNSMESFTGSERTLTRSMPQEENQIIVKMLEAMSPPKAKPTDHWNELEKAYQNGWVLTTKEVQELAGAKPHGKEWKRGAFIFKPAGKSGRSKGWKISKSPAVEGGKNSRG